MTPNKQVRSEQTKKAFTKYMDEHPDERFWQCVRNFSGQPFVMIGDIKMDERGNILWPDGLDDTFYREEM